METHKEERGPIIAIDFDGTCVANAFPEVGKDIGAAPVLHKLVNAGYRLILWTVRDREYLKDAVYWFANNEIRLYGVNRNPDWSTSSPKVYADLYIDDRAFGAPLLPGRPGVRSHVNWKAVEAAFFPEEVK